MSKEATRNQIADILARERKRLGLDKALTDEQVVYRKAEEIAKSVVKEGKFILSESMKNHKMYDREALKDLMQKQFAYCFMHDFSKEEMAFLLSVMHAEETISAVES